MANTLLRTMVNKMQGHVSKVLLNQKNINLYVDGIGLLSIENPGMYIVRTVEDGNEYQLKDYLRILGEQKPALLLTIYESIYVDYMNSPVEGRVLI